MSSQPGSRYRKQRFPRLDRRKLISSNQTSPVEEVESDEDSLCINKRPRPALLPVSRPFRPSKSDLKESNLSTCRLDKRARDEHNEQERSRRRELAVIYELIRCSFSNDDLRYLGHCNGPKSIDKLSYPQVLQIAYQLVREEQHNLILFEKSLNDMKLIEKEFVRAGLPVPERPAYPSITENYRKVVQIVDNLLKHDKSARSVDGVYEVTPAERAAYGDQELAFLRPRSQCHFHNQHCNSQFAEYSDHTRDRKLFPSTNSAYGDSYLDKEDSRSCLSSGLTSSHLSGSKSKLKRSSSAASMDYLDIDLHFPSVSSPSASSRQNGVHSWLDPPTCLDDLIKYEKDVENEDDEDNSAMINFSSKSLK